MKNALLKSVVLATSICFVASCSTNTQQQNTVAGAATGAVAGGLLGTLASGAGAGWVVAAGVVAGGVIGGLIGHSMDSSDNANVSHTLSDNATNQPTHWKNHKTGATYTIIPTSPVFSYKGYPTCRKYESISRLHGKTQQRNGVACLQANGHWAAMKS